MEVCKEELCESNEIHEDLLKIVDETLPEETELYDLAELFKVFGDSTRIRILFVLFEAEVCVCDLAKALNMTQSAISHQLRILKQNKLVKSRREGKSIFYSLADDHVRTIINQGREQISLVSPPITTPAATPATRSAGAYTNTLAFCTISMAMIN